jgi:hypothetical protein
MALTLDSLEYLRDTVAVNSQKDESAHSLKPFQLQEPAPVSVSIEEDEQLSMSGDHELQKPFQTKSTG